MLNEIKEDINDPLVYTTNIAHCLLFIHLENLSPASVYTMSHPMIGQKAPMLRLPSTPSGAEYALPIGDTNIALFFFPKANTTGCTKEACSFRDARNENVVFKRLEGDLTVVGISGGEQAVWGWVTPSRSSC